jgi:cytoskeletal protein RodZ
MTPTPGYPVMHNRQDSIAKRTSNGLVLQPSRSKARANNMSGIKKMIAVASIVTTVGGWAVFAGHDVATTSATQDTSAQSGAVSLVSQLTTSSTPTASATALASVTATPLATSAAQATGQPIVIPSLPTTDTGVTDSATATATIAATDTPVQPTDTATATATAAPKATATAKRVPTAVVKTRSSR